jgi:hypothetical protein
MSSEKHFNGKIKKLSEFKKYFYINILNLKMIIFENVNLFDLKLYIIMFNFIYV